MDGTICGVWIDGDGVARVSIATPEGGRREATMPFEPFAWLASNPIEGEISGIRFEPLAGTAALGVLARATSLEAFDGFVRTARESVAVDALRPLESQFLLQHRARLYGDLSFARLRRCQVDIETTSAEGAF